MKASTAQQNLRFTAVLAVAACTAAVGLAPIAAADITVHQNPGNAELTATPGPQARDAAQNQRPFGGWSDAWLFHH